MELEFSPQFSNNIQISNFIKIRPVGTELFHADRQTDRKTDMTKVMVTFRNFANAPKNTKRQTFKHIYTYTSVYRRTDGWADGREQTDRNIRTPRCSLGIVTKKGDLFWGKDNFCPGISGTALMYFEVPGFASLSF